MHCGLLCTQGRGGIFLIMLPFLHHPVACFVSIQGCYWVCWVDKLVWHLPEMPHITMGFNVRMKQHLPVILSVQCLWILRLLSQTQPSENRVMPSVRVYTRICSEILSIFTYVFLETIFAERKSNQGIFCSWGDQGVTFKSESDIHMVLFQHVLSSGPKKLKGGQFVAPQHCFFCKRHTRTQPLVEASGSYKQFCSKPRHIGKLLCIKWNGLFQYKIHAVSCVMFQQPFQFMLISSWDKNTLYECKEHPCRCWGHVPKAFWNNTFCHFLAKLTNKLECTSMCCDFFSTTVIIFSDIFWTPSAHCLKYTICNFCC